jgi:hypothetical protein
MADESIDSRTGAPRTVLTERANLAAVINKATDWIYARLPLTTGTQGTPTVDAIEVDKTTGRMRIGDGVEWLPLGPQGLIKQAFGPSTATDYSTVGVAAATGAVPVVSGRSYKLVANVTGAQVGAAGYPTCIFNVNGSEFFRLAGLTGTINLQATWQGDGSASKVWNCTGTGNASFHVSIASTTPAFRVGVNQVQIDVIDVGRTP